jgi:hypothetical protein
MEKVHAFNIIIEFFLLILILTYGILVYEIPVKFPIVNTIF